MLLWTIHDVAFLPSLTLRQYPPLSHRVCDPLLQPLAEVTIMPCIMLKKLHFVPNFSLILLLKLCKPFFCNNTDDFMSMNHVRYIYFLMWTNIILLESTLLELWACSFKIKSDNVLLFFIYRHTNIWSLNFRPHRIW